MANWSNPLLTSTYTDFLNELKNRDTDLALQFDGVTASNLPTGAIRWSSSINRWQKWSGSTWSELTTTYALTGLSTTGNASIGGTLSVTGATALATATATTPATGDNSVAIATTAWVRNQSYAGLASPTLTGTPTAPTAAPGTNTTQLATTAYVRAQIILDALPLSGGTLTGDVTLYGDPTAELHPVTRRWAESRTPKQSCRVATTTALTVTATTTTLTNADTLAALSIDTLSLSLDDRVLVKDQASAAQNGIYTVTTVGSGATAWVLTRASDADTWNDLVAATVAIEQGAVNDDTTWVCRIARGGTLGTTAIAWQLQSNAQVAALGLLSTNGLFTRTASGTVVARSLAVSGVGLTVSNADGVAGNPTVTSTATSANTPSTPIARDSLGSFSTTAFAYSGNPTSTSTGALQIPAGTTGQRPTAAIGQVRYNSTLAQFEGYNGSAWGNLGGNAPSGTFNAIINGNMAIDQRNNGAVHTIIAGAEYAYTLDRWYAFCSGANVTAERYLLPTSDRYAYRVIPIGGSVSAVGFGQRIERLNMYQMQGGAAALSVDLANTYLSTVTWTLYAANSNDAFGTRSSPTRLSLQTGTFTVTSTLTRYTAVISSIPYSSGLELVFTVGAQTSGTWTIANVQLESGNTATAFQQRGIQQELAMCQRYYRHGFANGATLYPPVTFATNQRRLFVPFGTPMRVAPTITALGISDVTTPTALGYTHGVVFAGAIDGNQDIECQVQNANASAEL